MLYMQHWVSMVTCWLLCLVVLSMGRNIGDEHSTVLLTYKMMSVLH